MGVSEGLSPRVRGNRGSAPVGVVGSGSIPACAGEPRSPIFRKSVTRVYPRVCGGTPAVMNQVDREWGLSPRVRGNRFIKAFGGVYRGSIPACAGEPASLLAFNFSNRVYPRVCGGTGSNSFPRSIQSGLSPRVRGNRQWAPLRTAE